MELDDDVTVLVRMRTSFLRGTLSIGASERRERESVTITSRVVAVDGKCDFCCRRPLLSRIPLRLTSREIVFGCHGADIDEVKLHL